MQVNVRDDSEETSVGRIIFGKRDEYLEESFDLGELILLYDPTSGQDVAIYKEDIGFLIKALKRAKEEWG